DDFVGRSVHLREVDRILGEVERGRGGLLIVTGEAGIGKTRLCDEAVARARARGLAVASAACWESASVAGLWPWSQLLRRLLADRPSLVDGLGARRRWIDVVVGGAPAGEEDPDTARLEVADAVVDLLRAAGRDRAGLLVLDDLHWADAPSVRLLAAVTPALRSTPMVLAVAYRDTDVGGELSELLPHLLRHGSVVALEGLTPGEVAELMSATTGTVPDGGVVDALYGRAGGNPLFTRELVRFGLDTDALPPTVGATLGARIGRLSAGCRQTLTVAALAGDEFTPDLVALAAGAGPDEVLGAIDEAASARLVETGTGPGRFRFTHALARAAALEGIGLAQRVRLHASVGAALETLRARGLAVDAAALAHHFAAAAAVAGCAGRAVTWSMAAAAEAGRRTAYEEAARLLRQAVGALDLDPAAADRVEVLLALGDAEQRAGASDRARRAYREAARLAREGGLPLGLARAALGVGSGGGFEVVLADQEQIDLLEEALVATGDGHPALRSRLCGRLSIALTYGAGHHRRLDLADEAVELARASGDREALAWALAAYCDAISGPADLAARERAATEVVSLAQGLRDRRLELLGRRLRAMALLERGQTAGFDREVDDYAAVAGTLRQPLYLWLVPLWRAMRLGMAGQFDEADGLRREALALGERAGSANAALLCTIQDWCLRADRGRGHELPALLEGIADDGLESTTVVVSVSLSLAVAGRPEEARAVFEPVAGRVADVPVDSEWLPLLCQLAVLVDLIGGHRIAAWAYDALLPFRDQFAVEGIGCWCRGSAEEFLGLLALAQGRRANADRHLAAAAAADGAAGATVAALRAAARRAPGPGPGTFRRTGDGWELAWAGTTVHVPDRKGLHDLARMLASPGREVAALDLAGTPVVEGAGDEILDVAARHAYATRLRRIESELDESDGRADTARSARLAAERDALVDQLTAAYGLGGRSRRLGPSAAERARSSVTQRIREAVRLVERRHPEMAAHLRESVRTGAFCVYDPREPVTWQL
ncbi:MAG: ATP-binding protein, partial [Actinomycetota bacterium]